jgi:hypothetical protein
MFGSCRYMYCRLPYVFGVALHPKSCTLIHIPVEAPMQYNHPIHQFHPSTWYHEFRVWDPTFRCPNPSAADTPLTSAPDYMDFVIDPLWLPRCIAVFVLGGFPFAPPSSRRLLERPRLPMRLLTLGNLDSSTLTTATLGTTSSTTTIHPPSRLHQHWLKRATIRMSFSLVLSPIAAFAPHRRSNCGGMSVCRLSPTASSLVSPCVVLPLWLRGNVRLCLVVVDIRIVDCHMYSG